MSAAEPCVGPAEPDPRPGRLADRPIPALRAAADLRSAAQHRRPRRARRRSRSSSRSPSGCRPHDSGAAARTSSARSPATACSSRSPRWPWSCRCSCRSRSRRHRGDAVAGEANLGTLRYLLAIPAGRTRLLVVKYVAIVIFAAVATLLVAVVGGVIGTGAVRRRSDLTLLSGTQIVVRPTACGGWCLSVGYIWRLSPRALGAIGLFVSTLTEQPIGATIAVVLVNVHDVRPRLDLPAVLAASLAADPLGDGLR